MPCVVMQLLLNELSALSPWRATCNINDRPSATAKSASRCQLSLLSAILLWQTMPCHCYASYQPSARKVNYQLHSTVNHHRCAITFIRYRVLAYRPGTTTRAFNLSLKTHHQSVTINQLQWIDHQRSAIIGQLPRMSHQSQAINPCSHPPVCALAYHITATQSVGTSACKLQLPLQPSIITDGL